MENGATWPRFLRRSRYALTLAALSGKAQLRYALAARPCGAGLLLDNTNQNRIRI